MRSLDAMSRAAEGPTLGPSSSTAPRLLRVRSSASISGSPTSLASIGRQLSANSSSNNHNADAPDPVAVQATATTTSSVPSTPNEASHSLKKGLSVRNLSKLKMIAASQRKKLKRRNAAVRLPTTLENEERGDTRPSTPTQQVESKTEDDRKQSIASFETRDVKWKAMIRGDLEKFMYPSLRLEALYDTTQSDARQLGVKSQSMPTLGQVDEVISHATKVQWEMEKRFQNSTQSAPDDGHPRMTDEEERRRLQFDTHLETAEGLLRKKDMQLLDAKRQQGVLEALGAKSRGASGDADSVQDSTGLAAAAVVIGRERGVSLYQPDIVKTAQLIPRLPHTRKIIKEIQRHTSSNGQIQYYADKHNLFTKWKKLQVTELHTVSPGEAPQRLRPASEADDADDSDDDLPRDVTALSPRSLFFHECETHQILPEPIFSRIHEVPAPTRRLVPLPRTSKSFGSVVAKLVQAVHEKHAQHEDLVPTRDGKYVARKHHLALHLQHFGLGDLKLDALSKSLAHFQSIHVLDLSNNRLTDKSIIQLLECLETAATSARPPSTSGASSRTRRGGNELRLLNLSQNTIGVAGCAAIARFLGLCPHLTHLDLSHAKIGGTAAVAPLTSAIESHPSLQVVKFSYNQLGETCATLIGDMLTQPSCAVQELDISWNQICKTGAIAIGRSLRTNTMLKRLNLAMNRFADAGAEQLAAALAGNTSLEDLDLARNNLGGRSAVAFAFYLRSNRSLLHLRLDDNRIGATGAKALLHTVSLGSPCEFHVSIHDIESLNGEEKDPIFDPMVPAMLSPFALQVGASAYEYAVACELISCCCAHQTCSLSELKFIDDRIAKKPVVIALSVDLDRRVLVETVTGRPWKPPQDHGVFSACAAFKPPPMCATPHVNEASCLAMIRIIERGFSSREKASLLALALGNLYLTTDLAGVFVNRLRGSIDVVEIVGRLWPCLVDGDRAYHFLQKHLTQTEQRRLVDAFGVSTIQFSTANPTGRWALDLGDREQRKIAIWFAMINAHEVAIANERHAKRTDATQYGKGFNWRNASYNRKALRLTYEFFNRLPSTGMLEFDYVSTVRHEDLPSPTELTDEQLDAMLKEIGAEVFAIYIPLQKRHDLKYQLLLFHLAIANRFITSAQAHRVLQYFPKNYETCRFKIILAVHRMLIDLENFGEMLDRLVATDRRRVYQSLGYLNVVNPLQVDMDFEIDFERDDEKMLLRALVDLSMSCPMDMIRIESERSTVLVIYSMYQTNSVPSEGRMYFRYVSHPIASRSEFLRLRSAIFKHFLCGERLRIYVENAMRSRPISGSGQAQPASQAAVTSGNQAS